MRKPVATFIQGYLLMLGLIMPIGMQNAFVLNQGIMRRYQYWVATICTLADLVLVSLSVYGLGQLLNQAIVLERILLALGSAFLYYYAYSCLKRVWQNNYQIQSESPKSRQFHQVLLTTLAITLLNPHVYLDTVLIWGSYSVSVGVVNKPWLVAGGVTASLCWFFLLAAMGSYLAKWLMRPKAQRALDFTIAVVVAILASQLIHNLYLQLFAP